MIEPPSYIVPRETTIGLRDGFRFSLVNRNLFSDFCSCYALNPTNNELMNVFLRVKPVCDGTNGVNNIFQCRDTNTVVICPPETKTNFKKTTRDFQNTEYIFTFSRVFNDTVGQRDVFDAVVSDQLRSFLTGFNGLIFAYGTTSSGTQKHPGLIPRALRALFNSVQIATDLNLGPSDYSDVVVLSSTEREQLERDKVAILNSLQNSEGAEYRYSEVGSTISTTDFNCQTPCKRHSETGDGGSFNMPHADEMRFSLWLSFAEIYNECISDLLDPSNFTNSVSAKQPVKKNVFSFGSSDTSNQVRKKLLELRSDKSGNLFIKGVRWYPVNCVDEVMRLLTAGRKCQQVAATRLNQASSRSHSILTIKAIRVANKQSPNVARSSSLTFCDLAGSERTEKAATGGQKLRLREASNINTSLLTLGRCIEILRHNQSHPGNPKLVPYRESKLTRLFQNFFTGQGKACMIVNASPDPHLFDETLHALRFSALAKDIVIESTATHYRSVGSNDENQSRQREQRKSFLPRRLTRRAVRHAKIKTPPTVVPNRRHRSSPIPSSSDPSQLEDNDFATDTSSQYHTISPPTVDGRCFSTPNSQTTSDEDDTDLMVLDHYSKEELIITVQDLADRYFDSKAQLAAQESKLRMEMCEALHKQMLEMEQRFDECRKVYDKQLEEASNYRTQCIAKQATLRGQRELRGGCGGLKRLRPAESDESGSDDDDETCYLDDSICSTAGMSSALADARERIADLESELADQRDAIENLSKARDQLRLELTRSEFRAAQLLMDTTASRDNLSRSNLSITESEPATIKKMICQDDRVKWHFPPVNVDQTAHGTYSIPSQPQQLQSPESNDGPSTPITLIKPIPQSSPCSTIVRANPNAVKECKLRVVDNSCGLPRASEGLQSFVDMETRIEQAETISALTEKLQSLEQSQADEHRLLAETKSAMTDLKEENETLRKQLAIEWQSGSSGQRNKQADNSSTDPSTLTDSRRAVKPDICNVGLQTSPAHFDTSSVQTSPSCFTQALSSTKFSAVGGSPLCNISHSLASLKLQELRSPLFGGKSTGRHFRSLKLKPNLSSPVGKENKPQQPPSNSDTDDDAVSCSSEPVISTSGRDKHHPDSRLDVVETRSRRTFQSDKSPTSNETVQPQRRPNLRPRLRRRR